MQPQIADIFSSIRTLPLTEDAQKSFSRAVQIVIQNPTAFATVKTWLDEYYSEPALRQMCEREYRNKFAYKLRLLRSDSPTYQRRLAIHKGISVADLKQKSIREALLRGKRLSGNQPVIRSNRNDFPDEKVIDDTNVHLVWAWEDRRYRHQFKIKKLFFHKTENGLNKDDCPNLREWRLRRVVNELVKHEYPTDPSEHREHSHRIVAIAAMLMPEPLPILGEFGIWGFASELISTVSPTGDWLVDTIAESAASTSKSPRKYSPTIIDHRNVGREEVMFARMPSEPLEVRQWFPLEELLGLLRIAVDELKSHILDDAAEPTPSSLSISYEADKNPKKKTKKVGRPRLKPADAERRQIVWGAWQRAKENGVKMKDFCNDWNETHQRNEHINSKYVDKTCRNFIATSVGS